MGPSPPPGTLTQNPDSVALHISSLPSLFPSFFPTPIVIQPLSSVKKNLFFLNQKGRILTS